MQVLKDLFLLRQAAGPSVKGKELFSIVFKQLIEAEKIPVGQTFTVKEILDGIGLSRSSVIEALEPLIAEGLISAEQGRPYKVLRNKPAFDIPKAQANVISITEWAHSSGLLIDTKIVSTNRGNLSKLKNPRAWASMGMREEDELVEIRRLRSFNDGSGFKQGISEVSYFNLMFSPDVQAFYDDPKNRNVSYHRYFSEKAYRVLRSQYAIASRWLNESHYDAWFGTRKLTAEQKYYPFIRVRTTSFCKSGPLELSQSYMDSRVVTIDATEMNLKWVGGK